MLTMNMTVGKDTAAIWIVRINLDADGYLYFADVNDKVTLSAIDFDGKVIFKDSLSEIEKYVDVSFGGSIGQVGNFGFSVARHTSYTGVSNFFNDLYPATSKPLLTSKTVDVGIVWSGATLTTEITWLHQFYVEDYSFQTNRLDMFCIEYDELQGKDLPPFVLQEDFNDGISYYTNASDDFYGQAIPIIYGDFTTRNLEYEQFNFVPTVAISKGTSYKIACHICHTVEASSYLYEYLEPVETVMQLSVASPTAVNTRAGHNITLAARAENVKGRLMLMPRGYISGGSDYANAIDTDAVTYATLDANDTMKWQVNAKLSDAQFGIFSFSQFDSSLMILWDSSGGNVDFQVKAWDLPTAAFLFRVASGSVSGTGNTITFGFGDGNYFTPTALENTEFHILNLVTSAASMQIKHLYFDFQNLTKYELERKGISTIRNYATGNRNPQLVLKRAEVKNYIESGVYAYVKGMMADSWID